MALMTVQPGASPKIFSSGVAVFEGRAASAGGAPAAAVFRVRHAGGLELELCEYGALISGAWVPDRRGVLADVVLGYDSVGEYVSGRGFLGAIVGRCANRVAGGVCQIDGRGVVLSRNEGENHLHGGFGGFHTRLWRGEAVEAEGGAGVRFRIDSPAGDEGYPGRLIADVTYAFTVGGVLVVDMRATTTEPTLCNLAQHAYWNLAGHASGSVSPQRLRLWSSHCTPTGADGIPTGEVRPLSGTPFDLRSGPVLAGPLAETGGLDLNFAVDGEAGAMRPVAVLEDAASGRTLELRSDQPGVQVYTGNFFDGTVVGKGGVRYVRHAGVCLETQCFPDAVNHRGWHAPLLRPGETYRHRMEFRFGVQA